MRGTSFSTAHEELAEFISNEAVKRVDAPEDPGLLTIQERNNARRTLEALRRSMRRWEEAEAESTRAPRIGRVSGKS